MNLKIAFNRVVQLMQFTVEFKVILCLEVFTIQLFFDIGLTWSVLLITQLFIYIIYI